MQKETKDKIFGIVLACLLIGVVIFGVVYGLIRESKEDDSADGIIVVFMADETEVSRTSYAFEDMQEGSAFSPDIPEVPAKKGYIGEWDWSSVISEEGVMTVEAKYTAIEYKVKFVADGEQIAEIVCTVEDHEGIPAVPEKEGLRGMWVYVETASGEVLATAVYYI